MARIRFKHQGVLEEVGPYVEGYRTGVHGHPDVRNFLQGSGAGDPTIRVRNLGDATMHHEETGRISPKGDTPSYMVEDDMEGGWVLGLPTFGCDDGRGGIRRGGYLCCLHPKYSHTVNCDHTNYGYESGSVSAPWGVGVTSVVKSG